jgi:hypothetical protein
MACSHFAGKTSGCRRALRKLISTFKEILEMRLNFNSYKMQLFRVGKIYTTFICIDEVTTTPRCRIKIRSHHGAHSQINTRDRAENLGGLFQERLGWCRQRRRRHRFDRAHIG